MQQSHEITITPQELALAVQQNQSKGWQLVETVPQEDGKLLLRFQRAGALQPMQQQYAPPASPVNPDVAWLELIGLFGILGIGYIAANRTGEGLVRLLGFIVWSGIVFVVTTVLIAGTGGLFCCLVPFIGAIQIGIPIWSAMTLKRELEAQRGR